MLIAYDSLKNKTFISLKKCILVFCIQSPRCNLSAPYKLGDKLGDKLGFAVDY